MTIEHEVYEVVGRGSRTLSVIATRAGASIEDTARALAVLEGRGLVVRKACDREGEEMYGVPLLDADDLADWCLIHLGSEPQTIGQLSTASGMPESCIESALAVLRDLEEVEKSRGEAWSLTIAGHFALLWVIADDLETPEDER